MCRCLLHDLTFGETMAIGDGIGKRIQQARQAKNMSASRLAREVDVSSTAVWNWEQNEIAPRAPLLAKIAVCLGVSEEFLRTGKEDQALNANLKPQSVAEMLEKTRTQIAQATGFPLEQVKLHLELGSA
jgi:transcriptional regulator with XRE-family HTH domain